MKVTSRLRHFVSDFKEIIRDAGLSTNESKVFLRVIATKHDVLEKILKDSEVIRERIMQSIWLDRKVLLDMEKLIWNAEFLEPKDVFLALNTFFATNYKWFAIRTFKLIESKETKNNGAIYYFKDIERRNIQENHWNPEHFLMEKNSLFTDGPQINIKNLDHPENATISFKIRFRLFNEHDEVYVISFYAKPWTNNKTQNLRDIEKISTIISSTSLLRLVQSKLDWLRVYIDELTWLYNHRYINAIKWQSYSLVVIDVNDFKKYNDNNWHQKWDDALKELWAVLKDSVRMDLDKPCRSWWDEFIVFVGCDDDGDEKAKLEAIKQRINEKLNKSQESKKDELKFNLTIWYDEFDPDTWYEDRLRKADFKMYKNKSKRWKRHRITSQYRDYMDEWRFIDNFMLMYEITKEFIIHAIHKVFFLERKKKNH